MSGIVYTTVDFKPRKNSTELYANLGMHRATAGDADTEHAEMVEYTMLAIKQWMVMKQEVSD